MDDFLTKKVPKDWENMGHEARIAWLDGGEDALMALPAQDDATEEPDHEDHAPRLLRHCSHADAARLGTHRQAPPDLRLWAAKSFVRR